MTDTSHTPDTSPPDDGGEVIDAQPESEHTELGTFEPEADQATSAEHLGLSLPDDPDEAQGILLRELTEARQDSGELMANLQRVAAEFDNYRKRTERDQLENVQRAGQRVIESLFPTLDSLDAALAIEATSETEVRMLEGMRGTEALLLEALKNEGCEPIEAVGKPFDPALHEAVSVIPGDGEQVVTQDLRKGYVMRGRVVRPSLVIVGHA